MWESEGVLHEQFSTFNLEAKVQLTGRGVDETLPSQTTQST